MRTEVARQFPLPELASPFIAAQRRHAALRQAGHRFMFEPQAISVHEFDGVGFELEYRRQKGFQAMERQSPKSLLKVLPLARNCLRLLGHLFSSGHRELKPLDMPVALTLSLLLPVFEIGGMLDSVRGRDTTGHRFPLGPVDATGGLAPGPRGPWLAPLRAIPPRNSSYLLIAVHKPAPGHEHPAQDGPAGDGDGKDEGGDGRRAGDGEGRHQSGLRRARCAINPLLTGHCANDRRAGDPDADGLGHHPRRPPADGRHVRPADQPPLRQRDACWRATSCSASATAGPIATPARSRSTRKGRNFVHVDIEPTQIGRVFMPDFGIVSRRQGGARAVRRGRARAQGGRHAARTSATGPHAAPSARQLMHRKTHFTETPIKPHARLRGDEQGFPRDTSTSRPSACRRSPARSSCTSTGRGSGSTAARPARWAGPYRPRWAWSRPTRRAQSSACRATTTSSS